MAGAQTRIMAAALVRSHGAEGVDVASVAKALKHFKRARVDQGAVLYSQGESARELQLLVEGSVSVRVQPDDHEVAVISAPAIIGHLGVLTGLPRSATVRAVEPLTLGRMTDDELWRLLETGSPAAVALRRLLLASLVGLLDRTNKQVATQVAEHGQPVPQAAVPPRKARPEDLGASDSWGFDADLLEQAEDIKVVQSPADKKRTYNS